MGDGSGNGVSTSVEELLVQSVEPRSSEQLTSIDMFASREIGVCQPRTSFGVIDVVPGTVEADVRCESMVPSICGDVFVMVYVCTTPIRVEESQYSNTSNIDGIGLLNAARTTLGVSNSSPEVFKDGIRCPDLNNIRTGFLDTTHVNMSEHFTYPRASSSRGRRSNFRGVNEQVDGCNANVLQNCQPRRQTTQVSPFEYVCMGECNQVYCHCGALFWLKESLSHSSTRMGPRRKCGTSILPLYIFDMGNEVANRMRHFGVEDGGGLKRDIVDGIIEFLDNNNALCNFFGQQETKSIGDIVFESDPKSKTDFDIIIKQHSGPPQMEGYMADMKMIDVPGIHFGKDKQLKMNMYYAYEIHERLSRYNLLPIGGRLFQQYVVTAHCSIEQSRIDFIRDIDGNDVGSRKILPQYFTGGPTYMYAHYLDALAICRVHGNPSFFVTFTCNVKWPEIKLYMEAFPELTVAERLDIVDRVFERKVHDYISFFIHDRISKVRPSACHSLICISEATKVQRDEDVNKYISAELPDPAQDPEGYRVVSEFMVHGSFGQKCSLSKKRYDVYTEKQNFQLNNSYVIRYKRTLSMRHYAHINVEYCGWTMLIKYLFKYISKGTDRVVAYITRPVDDPSPSSSSSRIQIDEIKNYLDARYVGPHEACWIILRFDLHSREPTVRVLAVHLQNMQRISFRRKDKIQSFLAAPCKK
uniref:DNA helicase n=1 Tax=Tanacetum cinerariifolium TaxID=118510 RepID=A0A6L2MAT5_TANCI|nr:DNA helicase [Tanacetum cinerariifolium]